MPKAFLDPQEEELYKQGVRPSPMKEEELPDEQAQGEQTLQQLAATAPSKGLPTPQAPESDLARYQRLSQEAEEAAPTQEDVLSAGLRRTAAELRAEAPAYLQQAATTAFYKPDFSEMTRVAQAEAQRPDMALTAKQQAQKRLEDLAEGARKRALLPGQMKEQEVKSAEAQAKVDMLKPATDQERAAAEQELGIKFGPGTKKGDIDKARSESAQTIIKGRGVPLDSAKRNFYQNLLNSTIKDADIKKAIALPETATEEDAKNLISLASKGDAKGMKQLQLDLAGQRYQLAKDRLEFREQEQERGRTVTDIGKAATAKNADLVRQKLAATDSAKAGIDALKDKYAQLENTKFTDIAKNTELTREIGMETKNLIMSFKEKYGLGAPQTAELKFLFNLVGNPDPSGIFMTQAINKLTGTTTGQKLDSLKNMLDRDFNITKKTYIIEPETKKQEQSTTAGTPEMVNVVSPDGRRGKIPKDKLDAARKKGFKLLGE